MKVCHKIIILALALCVANQTAASAAIFDFTELFESANVDIKNNFGDSIIDKILEKNSYSCSPKDRDVEITIAKELHSALTSINTTNFETEILQSGGACKHKNTKVIICRINKYRLRRISGDRSYEPIHTKYEYVLKMIKTDAGASIKSLSYTCKNQN